MIDDPLLPALSLRADVLGEDALVAVRNDRRIEVLQDASQQLLTFKLELLLCDHLLHMRQKFVMGVREDGAEL